MDWNNYKKFLRKIVNSVQSQMKLLSWHIQKMEGIRHIKVIQFTSWPIEKKSSKQLSSSVLQTLKTIKSYNQKVVKFVQN